MRKPWKYAISGLFLYPKLFDLFSQNLTKSDRKIVVNTEGTALFWASVVKFWGKFFEMRERNKVRLTSFFDPRNPMWKPGFDGYNFGFSKLQIVCQNLAESDHFNPVLYSYETPSRKLILPGVFVFSEEKPPLHSPVAVRNGNRAFFISADSAEPS